MIYYRFSPEKEHAEICGYSSDCGKPAVGYNGKNLDSRVYLCAEHFEYGRKLDGDSKMDVRYEHPRDKEYAGW